MQKSLWITTNNYHMTISHMTIWQLPYGRMNPSPPHFPVPLFVLLPTSFQSDWFLVLHVTLLLSTQVLRWPNLNYELWCGRICGWGRLVWRNAETGDFFFRRMMTRPQFWANICKLVSGQPTKKWSLQYLRYLCTRSPSQCTGGLYKAAHRMLTPESQRGLGSPLAHEQHDFSLLSRWIAARKVFRRKCKARKVRRSKA